MNKVFIIPASKQTRWVNGATWLGVISMWVVALVHFQDLPQTIPMHFNGKGDPDYFGSKGTLFFLPLLGTLLALGMGQINRLSRYFSKPMPRIPKDATREDDLAPGLIMVLRLEVVLVFLFLIWQIIRVAEKKTDSLGPWFIPLVIAFLMIPTAFYLAANWKKRGA